MSALLWAIALGCAITFVTVVAAYTTPRARRGMCDLLDRKFPNITRDDFKYFFYVVRTWAVFLLPMSPGFPVRHLVAVCRQA